MFQIQSQAKNKWNGSMYTVKSFSGQNVTLVRSDDTEFTINVSELNANYKEVNSGANEHKV